MLPLTAKATSSLGSMPMFPSIQASYSPLKTMEKKPPVPTSKILNVPATYALPGSASGAVSFQKTSSYLPQASPHYHSGYVRPPPTPTHQFGGGAPSGSKTPSQGSSPLKYQTPPTTYPPPIEAYQCPKINPNFLTPKYERSPLPRSSTSSFPSPSPVKFQPTSGTTATTVGTPSSATKSPLAPPPPSPPVSQVVIQTSSLNLSMSIAATVNAAPMPVASTSAAAAHQTTVATTVTATSTPPPAHSNSAGTGGEQVPILIL